MKSLRVAVIGAGYWGPNLVRNLNEAPGADPVAVADLSDERLETIHKRFPAVHTTKDHRELFADPSIDAVCIATPVGTHRRLSEEAFAAGKHVFVEKPIARTLAESEELKEDRAYLEKRSRELATEGFSCEAVLALGEPSDEIIKLAREKDVDLIAMTTHGHRFVSDILYGATADKVRHEVDVPVLLLKVKT